MKRKCACGCNKKYSTKGWCAHQQWVQNRVIWLEAMNWGGLGKTWHRWEVFLKTVRGAGCSVEQIAKSLGVDPATIRKDCKRVNVPICKIGGYHGKRRRMTVDGELMDIYEAAVRLGCSYTKAYQLANEQRVNL